MKKKEEKTGLSIFHRLLLWFIGITVLVAFTSGVVQYQYAKKIITESVINQIENSLKASISYFDRSYTTYIHGDLISLEDSDRISDLLTARQDEIYFHIPSIEKQFLNLIKTNTNYSSIGFFNTEGEEVVAVSGNKRIKYHITLEQPQYSNTLHLKMARLFKNLKDREPRTILFEDPFEHEGKYIFPVGISKLKPDTGGFGGALIMIVDLSDYFKYLSNLNIFGEPLTWVLDVDYNKLLSPPKKSLQFIAGQVKPDTILFFDKCKLGSDMHELLTVIFNVPPEIFASQLRGTAYISLGVTSALVIIATIIAFFVAKQFSTPIIELVKTSLAVSKGNLQIKVATEGVGEIKLLAHTFNKMTQDLQKTTVSRDYVDNIIHSMNESLIVVLANGAIQTVNTATCILLGYSEEELTGEPLGKILKEGSMFKDLWFYNLIGKGSISNIEKTYVKKNGEEIPVSFSGSVMIEDESILGVVCVAQDITERKRDERELQTFAERLGQSSLEMEQFVFIASHDLQEPLRKVMTFSGRLEAKFANKLDNEGTSYLDRMHRSIERMQLLIDSLLMFSRVSTSAKPFIQVDIAQLVEELFSALKVSIEHRDVNTETSALPVIDADPRQMYQLFLNLIDNALTFHDKEKTPHIKVSCRFVKDLSGETEGESQNSKFCQISVQDNGIGFEEKYLDRIFTVFKRLHNQDKYKGGTGMGLALCKKIVERHGGNITAKSQPGHGSTFIIILPVKQSSPQTKRFNPDYS